MSPDRCAIVTPTLILTPTLVLILILTLARTLARTRYCSVSSSRLRANPNSNPNPHPKPNPNPNPDPNQAPRVALRGRPGLRVAGTGSLARAAANSPGRSPLPGRGAAANSCWPIGSSSSRPSSPRGGGGGSYQGATLEQYDAVLDETAPATDAVLSGSLFLRSTSRSRLHTKPSGAVSPHHVHSPGGPGGPGGLGGSMAAVLQPGAGGAARQVGVASFGFPPAGSFGVRDAPSTPPHAMPNASAASADPSLGRVLLVTPSHVQTHAAAQLAAHSAAQLAQVAAAAQALPMQPGMLSPRLTRARQLPAEAYERSAKSGRAEMLVVGAGQAPPPGVPLDEWLEGLGLRAAHELLEQQRLELQRAGTPSLSDDNPEQPLDEMLASLQLSAISQWQAQRLQESIGGAG